MRRVHRAILTLLVVFLEMLRSSLFAQNIGDWQVYPSYWVATQNVIVGHSVYSLMNGNLLCHDMEDGSVKRFNCLDDLSDVHVSHLAYSQEAKRLILVYDNENIDLLDLDGNVFNIASLKDKALNNKNVNGLFVQGRIAYLSTGFGFLTIDMKEGVVLDTYKLGIDVRSITVCQDRIWLCGMNGVHSSPLENAEMHSLSTWKCHHTASNWSQIQSFGSEVYAVHRSAIYRFTDKTSSQFKTGNYQFLKVLADGNLYFGNASEINIYSDATNGRKVAVDNQWRDFSVTSSGVYWVSDGENGLRNYKLVDGAFVPGSEVIRPNSPCRDLFYRMQYVSNAKGDYRLLVAGGTNSGNNTYTDPVAMFYEDGQWANFDERPAQDFLPGVTQVNTTDLVQDPTDDAHHFAGTWRNGLKEYRDGKLVRIYTSDNSPLRSILPNDAHYHQYETATAATYDGDGNLWIANQHTDTVIRFITPEGKWHSLYYPEMYDMKFVASYLFSSSGINFVTCQFWPTTGFFAFDTNGTLTNVRDDRHKLITTLVNQDGTSYDPGSCYCMTEDFDGRIWCGTQKGLFVIDNPTQFFDDDFRFTQVKIARNDGSGLADYLLNGVTIQCIVVDGGNRKWIGTENNGVYLVSADGTELLQHFMAEDSPLLSNNVQCLAVHPLSGEVMIGTDKGLCSYRSDATEPESDLSESKVVAYPNPVRPDYVGPIRVEGLTYDSEVKICSVTGQVVWSGRSNGGTFTWNGYNQRGRRVSSGVYHVVASTADGNQAVVTRIIVIR